MEYLFGAAAGFLEVTERQVEVPSRRVDVRLKNKCAGEGHSDSRGREQKSAKENRTRTR